MDAVAQSLARQLVTHAFWRWREGMRTADGEMVLWAFGQELNLVSMKGGLRKEDARSVLPDLDDIGTLGHLIGMLEGISESWSVTRDRHGGYAVSVASGGGSSAWRESPGIPLGTLLARALLVAWQP